MASPQQTPPDNSTLGRVMKRFRASRSYTQAGFWDTWKTSWKLYNNQRTSIGYDGNVDVFIPETYTEVQGIKAHLINGNLEVEFLPTHPNQSGDVSTLQDLFNYAWMRDNDDQKLDVSITEYLVTGNSYVFTYPDEDGLPCSIVVSAKDAFFDPQCRTYEELNQYGYAGYRYLTTVEDLKNEQTPNADYDADDEKSQAYVPRYKNLDQIGQYSDQGDDKTAKQEREEMLGDAVLEDAEDLVEVIVYFDNKQMIRIANRSVVIEEVDTPFKREARTIQSVDNSGQPVSFELPEIEPFIPVAPFRNIVDANLWYAKGDVEVIADLQEHLNDTSAQKSDNLTYQLNRMWALDPNFSQKIDEIQSVPGAVFTIPPGALEQIPTQPVGADADAEIARTKAEMQAASGSNELMQGTLKTTGRQSAYQINQALVMTGARFQIKIRNLENEAMRIWAQNMWKIMQIFINKEIPIRVMGKQGATWATYNPGLYLGDWDVKIKLGATAETIKETERQQAMQFYLLASKLPFIDPQGLFVMVASQLFDVSKRDLMSLILPPSPTPQPTIVPKLIEQFKPEDLYPDEQAQILEEAGIQPSPMREEQTGRPSQGINPEQVAVNASMIHGAPQEGSTGSYEQAGMQTAGSPPVGAPTSGVANMPKVPNA